MALVALSVVEQRLDVVRAVLAGARVTEVAASVGVSRQTVHSWMTRYLVEGVAGLADRSHRPVSCPHQAPVEVEVRVAEMRRTHPRWGAKRIRLELLRNRSEVAVPSERTINRILARQGLLVERPRKRSRDSYRRWERPGPMQLWGIDIVGGVMIVNPVTGEVRGAKVVTGVDDHSRFCVIAAVVERATGRAVCLAFAQSLQRFGVPDEVLTDNGKQFTGRFGKGGEVLFDKICRKNAITHRLTAPSSPNQNGKVERFHLTLRRELLDDHQPYLSLAAAQTAVDGFVARYNTDRPHQGLDERAPVMPADRFRPTPQTEQEVLELWLPPHLAPAEPPDHEVVTDDAEVLPVRPPWVGGPIEFDRIVPPSGNLQVAGKQFWLGPQRAGQTLRFWADVNLIRLLVGGARIKTVRSHLTVNDLARLVADGATPHAEPMLRSALLVRRHDLSLALGLCLRVLLGAFLLERLARLLGHVLPRRFVGHDCSLSGSLAGFLNPRYAGIGASAHRHDRDLRQPISGRSGRRRSEATAEPHVFVLVPQLLVEAARNCVCRARLEAQPRQCTRPPPILGSRH